MMFIPLRVHSVYSKGRGGVLLRELAAWAVREKLPAAALSDLENLYGWARWKRAAQESGLRPVFGCELELGGRTFLFLVKEREGYWTLMETLNGRAVNSTRGLVTVFIPRPEDRDFPEELVPLLGEDLYLGSGFFNLKTVKAWSKRHGLPAVWAHPLKFLRHPERLILLHAIHKKIPFPPERDRLGRRMPLLGPDQAHLAVKKFGSGIKPLFRATFEVAEKCRFTFDDIVPKLPGGLFPTPLRDVVMEKLRGRRDLSWKERKRARMELEVVERSGFAPYFLVVHDVVQFARRQGILHNLKGSGASSFLAYLLGISHISPITFDLYFARFLNSGRDAPPDFDLDFDSRLRDRVLKYVLDTYGRGRTGAAFVCSLKNYRARSALYETARAFGLPPAEGRSMSRRIPMFEEPEYLKKDRPRPGCGEIWAAASELTSVYCEISLHVGGVLLTPAPARRYLPMQESAKGLRMSHFDRDAVEDLKLIKLDLLSVRGLAAISSTRKTLDLRSIPPQDGPTFRRLQKAETIGCFQVESPAMMNLLRRMRPETIYDLIQALALIRPGPTESGMKQTLLRGREGKQASRDPLLSRVLPETGGLLLYEEQVMQVADRVAGMPPEEGDLLRRGLKKKRADTPFKEKFFQEAGARGYTPVEVKRLWAIMDKFSSYSFNKAHSASYAHMAYQAVYLKTHHTLPYLTAVLNACGGYYGLPAYIEEAKRCGIRILGPDVQRSGHHFEVEGKGIRVGLLSIKGLAVRTADKIFEERRNVPYRSIEDLLLRVSLTKAELFALIKAGAFDSLEPTRTQQILRYFHGLEGLGEVADLNARQKKRMLVESLGFDPEGDSLVLFEGKRPELRIKDLKRYAGHEVELVVRVVDARLKGVTGGRKYFFLFEDETGLLEGVGETRCLTSGTPPACFLRAEIRSGGRGQPKAFNCTFRDHS